MTITDWDTLAELYERALALPVGERPAFVEAHAHHSAWLRTELRAMLAVSEDDSALHLERKLLTGDDDDPVPETLPAGTRIGAWRVEEQIGQGGMGEVYRATRIDGEFGQVVAIKLMRRDASSAEALRRFRTERVLLARLSHPHIATIVDGGTSTDGRPYFVMPFVEGVPITRFAQQAGLGLDARLRLFVLVADAVHHAHVRLIVHRDIKPSNILVTADGRPMLLDFGIAKLLESGDEPELTRTQHRLLTPEHAAPEQVLGEPVSTATDVYGLGVLLYEMLAGVRPFRVTGRAPADLERAIVHDEPAPPSSAIPTSHRERARVRGDLDRIVLMALRKEPDRRYGSAEQFADDVRRWLDHMPVRAQRDTVAYRLRQFVRRNRRVVAASSTGVVMFAVAGVVAMQQARARAVERDRALLEQSRAEDVLRVFTDLLKQSDPRVLPGGDTMRVKAFLDRADAEIESLAAQPERHVRLRRVLADVRASRGEYARAESSLVSSLARATPVLGAGHPEVVRTRQSLARVVALYRGQFIAAASFDRVLRDLLRTDGVTGDELAAAYVDLATATVDTRRAQALLDTAIALRTSRHARQTDSLTVASTLDAQGEQYFNRGDYAEAATLFRAALRIFDARLPADHFTRLSTLGNLAAAENALANWNVSEKLASEILEIERRSPTGAEGVARSLEELAVIHANLGRFAQAEKEERESIAALRSRKDGTHELVDNSRRNLAIILAAGGKVREGLALLDSVIANRRSARDTLLAAYLAAQRAPMLVRLGLTREAGATVAALDALVPTLAPTSRMRGDAAMYSGMAAMAAGRFADAVGRLALATREFDQRFPANHPRRAQAHCAYGAALVRVARSGEARPHLVPSCEQHAAWGLADPSVVQWGRAALAP